MELADLIDQNWHSYERNRFLKADTKLSIADFDPEEFKHDGFDDRDAYLETHAPALAVEERVQEELNNFTPPRVSEINDSPYQALTIRYGILRQLIQQPDYSMEKDDLLDAVQAWQHDLISSFEEGSFSESDDLLHLAKAAVDYKNQVDDSELHMVYSYFDLHNRSCEHKRDYYTWLDFFYRLSAIGRFPKVSRSESPEHALKTIEKGLWSLQEQALVYEVTPEDGGELVGIPEDYIDVIQDWLHYEMSDANFQRMLDTLDVFDRQSILIEARDTFDVTGKNYGKNQNRRENIVEAGVYPSELLREVVPKDVLKSIVGEYGLDAHRRKTEEMISAVIEYFERSQRSVDEGEPAAELFLTTYDEIADGSVTEIPPQLQDLVDADNPSEKMDILFEDATVEIFQNVFNLEGTNQLGQHSSGVVADGEITQGGDWLLWDNKRRRQKFRLGSSTRSKIKNYIDTKSQQHDVEYFLIIAPGFTESAAENALQLEMEIGTDIRLVHATELQKLATVWKEEYAREERELPLSVFRGSETFDVETAKKLLETQFS
ncbi:hypothetical protein C464_06150 [Halorubrum coriense DSM 10284]|uniref:Uncharacterized protein n=1 Tax=Halorubrum coriense DSM 10284 TaxID=1227466 RepID=M0EML6_9EURY|nr:hypothetical protein [Halorubrum coriense]ELZ48970.1 hypothetical protein C464_06150 [Halorubrum coriense DSM 10284]QRG24139.1 hypothetical protein HrrHm1_140 [Halorubrum virus Humcor1]